MKNLFKKQVLISCVLMLAITTTYAQLPSSQRVSRRYSPLPQGMVRMKLQIPFTNERKEYVVRKVPIDNEPGYDYYLLGGDMIVGSNRPTTTLALPNNTNLWQGDIPIFIDESIRVWDMCDEVNEAIKEFHIKTKIRFVNYTGQRDYIKIRTGVPPGGAAGISFLGRLGGRQEITINKGVSSSVIIHELMHALGVMHEHSRPDRDDYVKIHTENVDSAINVYAFDLVRTATLWSSYDYSSIMHYSSTAFAKPGKVTIECKNNGNIIGCPTEMGNARTLSNADILGLNAMYKYVQFSPTVLPVIPLPSNGTNFMMQTVSWDKKEVRRRNREVTNNIGRLYTINDAFFITIQAPQVSINHRNICSHVPEVIGFDNYANIYPELIFNEFNGSFSEMNAQVISNLLPLPYKNLRVSFDINPDVWEPGTEAINPYGRYGQFIVWMEMTGTSNTGEGYKVRGRWFDTRIISKEVRVLVKTLDGTWKRKIQSDGPMNQPGGYGPGLPERAINQRNR